MKRPILYLAVVLPLCIHAQQLDSLLTNDPLIQEFDSLFNSADSTSILTMIDNILESDIETKYSQLAARLGYNSNVVATSSVFGINQFGLAPGVSFYHHSGLYVDVTGYWSNEYDPNYYLTIASAGYLNSFTSYWSAMAEYSYYDTKINDDAFVPYRHSLGLTNFFEVKQLNFRLDYYFYFGEQSAHRWQPGVAWSLEKENWLGFDRALFFPSFNVLFGVEPVTIIYSELVPYTTRPAEILFRRNNGLPLFFERFTEETSYETGVMNYSLSAPIMLSKKQWNFTFTYTYNFPKALEGQSLVIANGGYVSLSVTRFFNIR